MAINLMIEGQEDVTWPQWIDLAQATEDAGLQGLFRSDHYSSVQGRTERGSLDAWATLAALGPLTSTIQLGTMVTPTSFRHPSVLAKQVVTADHTSGGRIELGIGAGWHELEHTMYGFDFPEVGARFDELAEQLEIISLQLVEESFDHDGERYQMEDCRALPKPIGNVPIIMGGSAGPRGAALAARWADEYNTTFPDLQAAHDRKARLDQACDAEGRREIPLSIMTGCILGTDQAEVRSRGARLMHLSGQNGDVDDWLNSLAKEWIVGTVPEAQERLEEYRQAGVSRFMLQHQLHTDLEMVALMGQLT